MEPFFTHGEINIAVERNPSRLKSKPEQLTSELGLAGTLHGAWHVQS